MLLGYRCQVDPIEAADIDSPQVRCRAGPSKRQDAADWTEIVFCGFRVPLVKRHGFKWRKRSKLRLLDPVVERTALSAQRAIAHPDVVQVSIDLEANRATVTGTLIRLEQCPSAGQLGFCCNDAMNSSPVNRG